MSSPTCIMHACIHTVHTCMHTFTLVNNVLKKWIGHCLSSVIRITFIIKIFVPPVVEFSQLLVEEVDQHRIVNFKSDLKSSR